ncbi:WXG100 family type VII secretion target [Nocardia sp. NPDC055002]|uniref:WXG100 family type VII secretion target n=1 Tax=Nocardia alba TaxID=225051 RepID=A0A4R1FJ27_9NOCA|nr:WXG100 family type VII secretion target [Nocardia alba]TCJ94393.1 WXG100 family type VII secretion target [Nocardia alba]
MAVKASVNAEAVKTFAHGCEDKHAALVKAIRDLKTFEDQLTATWTGEAKFAFDSFMERYYFQADKLNDKLLQTVENLMTTSGKFTNADEAFRDTVASHTSSLDLPAL